ncbi:MAG TPA: beta-N-acetylhexosaminidase [Candidatus Paenibacillus intestinavium]|nr:beta-N-acetylhexosaminidase [Candidatus Paenibacillus intestinavium]
MVVDISQLTVKQKIGQLLMVGFEGRTIPSHVERLFRDYHIGSIIYFRRNVGKTTQIKQLCDDLQQLSSQYSSIPLSIAIDQEGGMVARIDQDITVMPGQMTIGATGNATHAYDAGAISGMEMAQLGITVNFAPVLDVNNNAQNPVIGIRSFGENAELVALFGTQMINGYQDMGVSACAKHFPGHGDTTADSHYELPSVAHNLERIHAIELVPFKAAINANVDMIMTAHVQFPALEPSGKPATLSYHVLTELLREKLAFNGVIVTDCLEMNAISQGVGVGAGAVEAFKAGADLILVSHRLERQLAAFDALEAAIESGEISEERLNQSVERILKLKALQQQRVLQAQSKWIRISDPKSQLICDQMMLDAVTLVQDQQNHLPLANDQQTLVIWPEVRESTQVDEAIEQELTLGKQLKELAVSVEEVVIGISPTDEEIAVIIEKLIVQPAQQIVMGLYNATFSEGQQKLIQKLKALKLEHLIFISLRNPYDIELLSGEDTYICAYENRPAMIRAIGLVLVGKEPFKGQSPVQLNAAK